MDLSKVHTPSYLKKNEQKTSDMILAKKNSRLTAISGSTFSGGDMFEVNIQSSNPFILRSLRLNGKIAQTGDYTTALKLQDGVRSLISQVQVAYNTRNLVNITNDAQMVAFVDHNSNESQEEKTIEDVMQLVGTTIPVTGTSLDFSLPLKYYGTENSYFLFTGAGNQTSITLQFENDLKKVFFGAEQATKTVTGYSLTNVYLTADFYTLSKAADSIIRKGLDSSAGMEYPMLAYDVHSQALPQATTQNLLVPQSYRNVVTNVYIPRPVLAANDSLIPSTNPMVELKWTAAGDVPEQLIVSFSGGEPANIQGNQGQSGKAQNLLSLIRASKKYMDDRESGYGWSKVYGNAGIGVVGASFLKGNDKLPEIVDSGINGYESNGQLNAAFNLATAPAANGSVKSVIQFTRILKVSSAGTVVKQ